MNQEKHDRKISFNSPNIWGHHLHRGSFYELKKKSEVIFKNAIKVKQLLGNKTNIEKEYTKAVM